MAPRSERNPDDGSGPDDTAPRPDDPTPRPDGSGPPGFDEAALYRVVRLAVEDAILGVLGTLLLVGIAFVIVVAGFSVAANTTGYTGLAVGAAGVTGGFYLAAATLGVVPPVREWF